MARNAVELTGHIFGRLTVLQRVKNSAVGAARWLVRCDCGTLKEVRGSTLTAGSSNSCGCLARELTSKRVKTHGMTNTFEHNVWLAMKRRCTDPKHPRYHRYGARGIQVCTRWENFENFFADMGVCPFTQGSIERVDNNKGYEPSNCVWLLKNQQSKNRTFNPKH